MYEKNIFNQPIDSLVENWHAVLPPTIKRMEGQFCTLEMLELDKHSKQLFDALTEDNRGESWTYLSYGPFDRYDDFYAWLTSIISDKGNVVYAIVDAKSHRPIGIASYLRINTEHGVIEVGHLHYSKALKQTPAATEAMYLMMSYIFDELHYRRYEWKCNALNQPSREAALRLGFTFEGIFRQSLVIKNRNRDTAWFSILDKEWPAIKIKMEKWLNPTNFDANGKQLLSLREI